MGADPKYCKVTVHPAASPPRMRRQTVGDEGLPTIRNRPFKRAPPPVPPYKAHAAAVYDNVEELQEDNAADIAVLSEEEPISRRRTHTTSSLSGSVRLSNILNPLSRMTMRWTEHSNDSANYATESSTTSVSSSPNIMDTPPPLMTPPPMMDLSNSFLDIDTDGTDDVLRPTFEDTGGLRPTLDDYASARPTFEDTGGMRPTFEDARVSRPTFDSLRPTFEDVNSLLAGTPPIPAGLTLDMLPTEYETPPIPSHLRDVLMFNQNQQRGMSPVGINQSDDEFESESEIEDDDASSATTDDYGEDPTNRSVDIDSIRQTRSQALANFEASLIRRIPRSRITEVPRKVGGSARNLRGLSSPPRMMSQVIRRKVTAPEANHAGEGAIAPGSRQLNNEPSSVPMYHGQELHLAFKTTTGQITQVQGHSKRRGVGHKNPFSRRVRCYALQPYDQLEDADTLRIIGHTTDGLLRGGDSISLARTDGTVLRMQKISKKLTFSNKIDVRAKFVITGVPDRTPVTSTSKFYLQSVYDRKRTVGFMPSRRESHPGCLAMYVHRNVDDKVEPIQFFKRHPNHSLAFWHNPQQWV
ncbi:hypothetical protein PF010_g16386 [Phytophthora fragariae]|nr:hypothetical protein PF003_g22309 [Phytophthora fragariae]KAE8930896.1 hypothetical protein PF009_g19026 [Phytophthora fragariae]KAE9014045.1 hypothetical protein PF011_g8229 [Phytophthora fragariae]KAE9096323.1 hypothetical protein PF010_g16386 [Phytophthora fragariae]KAE9096653.1 hypothetical protein PF007_g16922 [Phytophthora fragariae]